MTPLEAITTKPLEEISVDELNLSIKGRRKLKTLGIRTLANLSQYTTNDFLDRNFWYGPLTELRTEALRYGVNLKTRKQREHEEICEAICRAKKSGADSQTLISKMIGIPVQNLRYHAVKAKIELPVGKRGVRAKRIPKRDRDIDDALSLRVYGKRWKMSHQGARDYIFRRGKYEIWQNARREILERNKEGKELEKQERAERQKRAKRLLWIAYERAKEIDDWAYQRAVEYCILIREQKDQNTSIPFENLLRLFNIYELVYENNEEPNYYELSKKSKIRRATVQKVIKTIEPWIETD